MLTTEFVSEMKQALLLKKEQLTSELAGLSVHTEMGDTQEENADEVNVDEANQDVIAIIKQDLEKINIALEKIELGTYGVDADGQQISEARLRVIPWADKAL
jgi:RNA polymerase-binding transcription factor DksA